MGYMCEAPCPSVDAPLAWRLAASLLMRVVLTGHPHLCERPGCPRDALGGKTPELLRALGWQERERVPMLCQTCERVERLRRHGRSTEQRREASEQRREARRHLVALRAKGDR